MKRSMKILNQTYTFRDGKVLPIVEASEGILFKVQACDSKGAKPRDPEDCKYAHSLKRVFESTHAAISAGVAYVATTYKGKEIAMRFILPKATAKPLQKFDGKTRVMKRSVEIPNEVFRLNAVPKSQTLAAGRKREKASKRNEKPRHRRRKITWRHMSGRVNPL